jgi:superfamily I DNA/RNA helicase
MVTILSEPSENATEGEKLFFNRISQVFENDTSLIAYYEPDINGLHPDFLLLSPIYGIIIIEIKDYSEHTLSLIPRTGKWEMLKNDEMLAIENPFDQIYQYWRAVKDRVNYCSFPKGLKIPILNIVIFSNISETGSNAQKIKDVAPNKVIVFFKEILNRNSMFHDSFIDSFSPNFCLSSEHFSLLRANIIPTSRLPTYKQVDLLKYFNVEDQVKLLDLNQERTARELGEGHRLIFGVAGSGKTVLLIARARMLALTHSDWKILILCYNKLLKNSLFQLLSPLDYEADITISTFHGWARNYILSGSDEFAKIYDESFDKAQKEEKVTEFFGEVGPKLLLDMISSLGEKKLVYDAILIDEAQDFEASWFLPIIEVLNPATNSLLITCDGLQGIYARKRFTWSSVGIQARGRVRRFEKSYRIPIEIGRAAQESLPDNIKDLIGKYDEFISTKEFVGNHGTLEIVLSNKREEEYRKLVEKIAILLKVPQEILVLFRKNMAKMNYNHLFFELLKKADLKWRDLSEINGSSNAIMIGTLHGTKGLESDTIIIPELDTYHDDKDRQLLYVGMTRAKKKLILSASKSTKLIDTLKKCQILD